MAKVELRKNTMNNIGLETWALIKRTFVFLSVSNIIIIGIEPHIIVTMGSGSSLTGSEKSLAALRSLCAARGSQGRSRDLSSACSLVATMYIMSTTICAL